MTKIEGIKNLNTAKVTDMGYMFRNCLELTTIYVSGSFTTDGVTNSGYMFSNCSSLVGAIGYNADIMDNKGANYATGYFTCAIKELNEKPGDGNDESL